MGFFKAQNAPKPVFRRGSATDPARELTTFPQTPQSAGEGDTLSLFPSTPSLLDLAASASRSLLTP